MSIMLTAPAAAPLDEGHYAVTDQRDPRRPRVQLYHAVETETGLDILATYGKSRPKRVARWGAELGLVAVGDNGHRHYDLVTEVLGAPLTARALYARTTGQCARCNRRLTDMGSVEAGLGPECAALLARSA